MSVHAREITLRTICQSTNSYLSEEDKRLLNTLDRITVMNQLQRIFQTERRYAVARRRAWDTLINLEGIDIVQVVIQLFDRAPVDWKTGFCETLASFPEKRAIEKLTTVLVVDKNANVRYAALEALEIIGDTTIIPMLEQVAMNDKGKDFEGRPVAEQAVYTIQQIRRREDKSEVEDSKPYLG